MDNPVCSFYKEPFHKEPTCRNYKIKYRKLLKTRPIRKFYIFSTFIPANSPEVELCTMHVAGFLEGACVGTMGPIYTGTVPNGTVPK